ncbi:MAG TPA: alkaline phosphatase family protein [Longimicrobiales bacterium]|nr:alkaline phosphatase family protein [Longimicrobiales bacterium]
MSRPTHRVLDGLVRLMVAVLAAAVNVAGAGAQESAGPRLVVAIVVDQLGDTLIDRYAPALTGGLRRFLEQGLRYTEASHAHAMTETAPGHATLFTGVVPARHGIVSNNWWTREGAGWRMTYAVADPEHPILGFDDEAALEGRSPANVLRTGLADWVRAADPEARTVSISKKDRTAVIMAGEGGDAWWILDELGIFVTSTYYAERYPDWIVRFNREVMPGIARDTVWDSDVPRELRHLARSDSAAYEGDGIHTAFPHRSAEEVEPGDAIGHNLWAFDQPRADRAVLELAKAAIDELDLGQRAGHTDLLAISFSALDRVGHRYGPFSQEAFSTLVHLDGVLAELLDYLDREVGEGRWMAGLAGDHGVAPAPEASQEQGRPEAERIDERARLEAMGDALRAAAARGPNLRTVADRLAELVEERGLALRAYPHHRLVLGGEPADSFAVLYRNSYYPGRPWGPLSRFGVDVRYGEGDLVTPYPTGTNHGSPYWYDRHVALMLLGPGVPAGESAEPVPTVDFAPTLAGLARIPVPADLDGRQMFP